MAKLALDITKSGLPLLWWCFRYSSRAQASCVFSHLIAAQLNDMGSIMHSTKCCGVVGRRLKISPKDKAVILYLRKENQSDDRDWSLVSLLILLSSAVSNFKESLNAATLFLLKQLLVFLLFPWVGGSSNNDTQGFFLHLLHKGI